MAFRKLVQCSAIIALGVVCCGCDELFPLIPKVIEGGSGSCGNAGAGGSGGGEAGGSVSTGGAAKSGSGGVEAGGSEAGGTTGQGSGGAANSCHASQECSGAETCSGAAVATFCVAEDRCLTNADCAEGKVCNDHQCQSAAPVGAPCSPGNRCSVAGYCDGGVCKARIAEGELCGEVSGAPCATGTFCVFSEEGMGSVNRCMAPAKAGEICQYRPCAAGYTCDPYQGTCVQSAAGLNQPCDDLEFFCEPSLYCEPGHDNWLGAACVPPPGVGEPCGIVEWQRAHCVKGASCSADGICQLLPKAGEACSTDEWKLGYWAAAGCQPGARCLSGVADGACHP